MKKFIIPKPAELAQVPVAGITPDKIRQAKSKAALLESGGKRVSINLTGEAFADLEAIKARDGLSNTAAIIAALRRTQEMN
jgi:hypothetical protein